MICAAGTTAAGRFFPVWGGTLGSDRGIIGLYKGIAGLYNVIGSEGVLQDLIIVHVPDVPKDPYWNWNRFCPKLTGYLLKELRVGILLLYSWGSLLGGSHFTPCTSHISFSTWALKDSISSAGRP